ncbi:hypothetical protein [Leptolyngbya sp. O-77]|uniref:hypothetical protein n=1 Tax=Leptolyngbya sp. O-77 TaxID=1080068 RepID=UPI00074D41EF|nr:hypothetical protein [Leptolyngbya sp. O-77]BAU44232.1 hypothetical protein O77CONTIG1_04071 [Leptolyngbya sp. O-77]
MVHVSHFLTAYLVLSAIAFTVYLSIFLKDPSTPKTDHLSWLVLIVATLLSPISLPISLLKWLKSLRRPAE